MDAALDHVTDGVLVVDADWRIARANAVASALLESDDAALVGTDVRDVFPQSAELTFHGHFGGEEPTPKAVTFEDYFPELGRWLEVRTVVDGDLLVYLRDVTARRNLEGEIADSEAELSRLNRINAIIQAIVRKLIDATTREEIEDAVCERLAASELYEFTWIGERDPTSGRIANRSSAGEYGELLDLIVDGGDSSSAPETPEYAVLRTGETQIVRQLAGDDAVPDQIRRVAFARGLQSAIAVPLQYGTTTYGVLGVYATRPDAFSQRERESFETLGVVTGFVINAARQRNLLLSDTVVELTFRVRDPEDFFVAASARHDCSLTVEGVVPLGEGALLCYVETEGANPDDVLSMAADRDGIADGRVIHETSDEESTEGGLLEVTLAGASPMRSLAERGATVRTAEFEAGVGRLVADVAPDEDIRELVEAVVGSFPESSLLAKRDRQRPVETAQEFRSSLHDRLTDRQLTALRVAHHGGYFLSPRDSTAEELADELGISSPTLHYHLRAAQRKLVEAFLEENPGDGRRRPADDWHEDAVGDR
jgi:hypothetical protein